MSKQKVSITNNSIKGDVTSDAKRAICEYIWNGFDANAVHVDLTYKTNGIGAITSFKIKDDGDGIDRKLIDTTFGQYKDSIKGKSYQWSSQVKGHKGKGRYAFNCFATKADWESIYQDGDNLLKHHISIESGDNAHFNDHENENEIVHNVATGTTVTFSNVNLTESFFESVEFVGYLKREYAVFLKLNENLSKEISINGEPLDYNSVIAETEIKQIAIVDPKDKMSYEFNCTFIRWHNKMRENYSTYFLDNRQIERYEKTTTLNKKDTGFHHSVYVVSSYFNDFIHYDNDNKETEESQATVVQGEFEFPNITMPKTEKDKVFKDLWRQLKCWIEEKQKQYIANVGGEKLWARFIKDGTVSEPTDAYKKLLYEDLKQTVKGIYAVQPKIFTNIKPEQARALVGCLELLLQTDKREDLIKILEGIVSMTDDDRHRLAEILQVTQLSNITKTIELLNNRLKTVSAIKAMIYDKELHAREVPDIQNMISSAFWLFGEQYNIVTEAEPDFQQALERYLEKIHETEQGKGKSKLSVEKIKHPDANKEMDIFAFRQTMDSKGIENVIVELKRPTVQLGELELSQVKTYMRLIYSEPQFNSTTAKWTFILVGNQLDDSGTIENEYDSNKTWGKKDLVLHVDKNQQNYEIYVKTWATVFDDFEIRHNFLLKELSFKRDRLTAVYNDKKDLHNIVKQAKENDSHA